MVAFLASGRSEEQILTVSLYLHRLLEGTTVELTDRSDGYIDRYDLRPTVYGITHDVTLSGMAVLFEGNSWSLTRLLVCLFPRKPPNL